MNLVGRFNGVIGWGIAILLGLGLVSYMRDHGGLEGAPGLGPVPWEYIEATSFSDDCLKAGKQTYVALGEKDGAVLSLERPCSDPPPENLR